MTFIVALVMASSMPSPHRDDLEAGQDGLAHVAKPGRGNGREGGVGVLQRAQSHWRAIVYLLPTLLCHFGQQLGGS